MYHFHLRLNEKLEKALKEEASETGRNKSDVIRVALANEVLD